MRKFIVLGAGKFGRYALGVLRQRHPSSKITIVDGNRTALPGPEDTPFDPVCRDAIDYLADPAAGAASTDWIIPAIPVHVAFAWTKRRLEETHTLETMPVPEAVVHKLPHPIDGKDNALFTSNADFICPPDCPEPASVCTCTGKPRPRILHDYLRSIRYGNLRSVVVVSRQLAPGVGGYRYEKLVEAFSQISQQTTPILLSTACRCHGVVHAFSVSRPAS